MISALYKQWHLSFSIRIVSNKKGVSSVPQFGLRFGAFPGHGLWKRQLCRMPAVAEHTEEGWGVFAFLPSSRAPSFQSAKMSCFSNRVTQHLTVGIHSENYVIRQFYHCANSTECTYTNLDGTGQWPNVAYWCNQETWQTQDEWATAIITQHIVLQ